MDIKKFEDEYDIVIDYEDYTNLINTSAREINDMTVGIVFPNGITPFGQSILDTPDSVNANSTFDNTV